MVDKEVMKICGICGDKAIGYNFNAITCESCKAFFRRNAMRKQDFKCHFDGNCKLDSVTRKFCKECRLNRCFSLGMKKEWILSDEEKLNLRKKISENRKKRQKPGEGDKNADSTTANNTYPNVVQLIQSDYTDTNGKIINVTECHDRDEHIVKRFKSGINQNQIISSTSGPECTPYIPQSHSVQPNPISKLHNSVNCQSVYDSLIEKAYRDESHRYLDHTYTPHMPKPMYSSLQTIDSDPSLTSDAQLTSNKCSVITVNPMENIRNKFIDSIGNFNTKKVDSDMDLEIENCSKYESNEKIPDNVYRKVIELEFANIPPFKQDLHQSNSFDLNKYEIQRLDELAVASAELDANRYFTENVKTVTKIDSIFDLMKMTANRCDQSITYLIEMSKKMQSFDALSLNDRMSLMKASCFEILIMRSVLSFNYEDQQFTFLTDQHESGGVFKLDVLKQTNSNVYHDYRKFITSFKKEWNNDITVLNLLMVIILFNPELSNVEQKELIKLEQQIYMYLLQRYLLSKYKSKCEAKLKFLRLMSKLEELHTLHDEQVKMYLDVDPQYISPLLIEILDLNPRKRLEIL